MNFVKHLYRATFQPASTAAPVGLWRAVLRMPALFDLVSLALQARDIRRLAQLKSIYVAKTDHHRKAHDYNAGVTTAKQITTTRRAEEIYQILALPPRDLRNESVLIVGPRNVAELYIAWLYGYSWRNISAIDLYSTNPKIRQMNMEDMEFGPESFDAVTMSATLVYAENMERAIAEVARILKPGGRFVFGHPYYPQSVDWHGNLIRASEIKEMLARHGMYIYFHNSVDKTNSAGRTQTSHRIGARKLRPDIPCLDPLTL